MSEAGFHVHGPHDHELEHAAQHGDRDSFTGSIAVMTAILATIGALFAYMGGATQANAGLYKNNAAIKKTEASNQWNYYQAKSSKQNLSELAVAIVSDDKKRPVPGRGRALQKGEGRDQGRGRQAGGRSQGLGRPVRRPDAPASPLGPGDHGAADFDRAGCDRAADAAHLARSGACSAWPASASRSGAPRCCTSDHRRRRRLRARSRGPPRCSAWQMAGFATVSPVRPHVRLPKWRTGLWQTGRLSSRASADAMNASLACARQVLDAVPLLMREIRSEMRQSAPAALSVPSFRALIFAHANPGSSLTELAATWA